VINRRGFSQGVAIAFGAVTLAGCSPPPALSGAPPATSFPALRHIEAGVLSVGYTETGPPDGKPVILLHGWPYDIHSYVDVAPRLAADGYRVIVPYLRGYGETRFLSEDTARNGQQSAVATDIVALMDALNIPRAVIGGFDWGARTACVIAALWPDRCTALVSVSGYLITNLTANLQPLPPSGEHSWWYQYYFSTERGAIGYRENTRDFNKLIWAQGSPHWDFDDTTYERTAAAFTNIDHVDIVIHNYRWRLSLADGEPQFDELEAKLALAPVITVPTVTIASDFDGSGADGTRYRDKFTGAYEHRVFAGIGHNVPQEAPTEFADAIVAADPS
jgi:pimeloyl-ACP methyl ester carboxylesterase